MSLFSSLLKPILEKELQDLEPQIAQLLLNLTKKLANEVVEWAEEKLNLDINQDGKIGDGQ